VHHGIMQWDMLNRMYIVGIRKSCVMYVLHYAICHTAMQGDVMQCVVMLSVVQQYDVCHKNC